MPVLAAVDSLDTPLAVFGGMLVVGALLAGLARRSFLSLTALFVVAGFVLGDGGLGVLDLDPRSGFVSSLAVVALIVILFRDGLEVEAEMLQRAWHLPLRKLALAMPLTTGLVAVVTHALTDLGWTESFLVGALLAPTDPVLSSTVVTNPRVPRLIRHSLNLESGLNDGLALPAVLAFTAAAEPNSDFVWWTFVIQDVGVGLVTGLVVAFVASRVMPRGEGVSPHQKALYALGVAFVAYGTAVLPPEGNGFISVFVARDRLRHLAAGHPGLLRDALRGHDRGGEARRVPGVRRHPHDRSPVRGRLGRGGHRRLHPAARAPDRGVRRAGREPAGGHRRARRSWPGSGPRAWPP